MTTTARQVRLLAECLDGQGKADVPITVIGSRAHLRKEFPAEKRGETPAELQNLDWVGA
jgi:hypothetical protein